MPDFEKLIRRAKENDENAMLEIIEMFKPLINKKFKESYYNEDVKSELTLKLIEIVKCKINLDKMREVNNNILIKYIAKSIHNHFIHISKKDRATKILESGEYDEEMLDSFDLKKSLAEIGILDFITFEDLKSLLTKREFDCVYYNVFMGYTVEEISRCLHITRQACNQRKLRAFIKICRYYESHGK